MKSNGLHLGGLKLSKKKKNKINQEPEIIEIVFRSKMV